MLAFIEKRYTLLVQKVCCTSFSEAGLARGDVLFYHGEVSSYTYYIMNGEMVYKQRRKDIGNKKVQRTEWVCEAVMWMCWAARGDMQATEEARVIRIDPTNFGELVATNYDAWRKLSRYAKMYVTKLN